MLHTSDLASILQGLETRRAIGLWWIFSEQDRRNPSSTTEYVTSVPFGGFFFFT
ncbi:hypothetical protein M407DRAFT_241891 [Tulasnella calospora MUT 4182]|uniref:Uncharacterized protein n=1 Tax=Tulasnella calospora MUT 4182 TaxID=1051891 RepID=A0A0C3MBQ4_9AGAM|nr:hypothetical protein M407DRAFT_241891 [Tulasnella calospora MUT 4182]